MTTPDPTQSTALSATTIDWLATARDAFVGSTTYFDNSIRYEIEQDIRQFQSVHPAGSKYYSDAYRSRSRFFEPKTRATIRKHEATAAEAFFANEEILDIDPEDDSDVMQQAGAALMKELVQYRLTHPGSIPWFLTVIAAYQEAMAVGVVVSYQCWEYDKAKGIDRPAIKLRPVENIRIDPAAEWCDPINTSPYLIDMLPMYVKDVRARMNKIDPKTKQPIWKPIPDAEILQAVRNYSDSTRLTREGLRRTDSKDQIHTLTDFTIVWIHKNIVEVDGIDWLYYTLGTTQMLSEPVPLKQVYRHGRRPYVMGFCALEAHRLYPSGVSRLTRDSQGAINNHRNQRFDNVSFAMNKRYFVKRGKRVDLRSLVRNVPSSVTLMDDPEKDVVVQETQDVTSSAYAEQDRLNLAFDDVAGVFSGQSVQSNRSLNETVGGMNILAASSNKVENYQLRTFIETWAEPAIYQVAELEKEYETNDIIIAVAGRRANLPEEFGVQMVTEELLAQNLSIKINIGMGLTSPQEQVNRFMYGLTTLRDILQDGTLERYNLKIGNVIKEIFGKPGYKSGGRFFDEGQDPEVSALRAMVKQLEQRLAMKQDPELTKAQIKKIMAEVDNIAAERVKRGVEAAYSAMQAAGVVVASPATAPVADTIMAASGYQVPNPAGADPDFGVGAMPTGPVAPVPQPVNQTHPNLPAPPASPEMGVAEGIETPVLEAVQ